MYHAKAAGRNTYLFFTAEMNAAVQHRLAVETGLRQALAREEFLLHYQPQVDATSGALVGVEALIRWRNPTSGLLFPGAFIGVAEDLGLIVPIGIWVLRRACAQVMAWQAAGLGRFRVAVNVSARQFARSDLSEVVREVLAETGLPPALLDLEITETEMMQQTPDAMATLQRIHDLGVGIAVDDFGIGYSSLGYIKRLPIDRLKIDKSFVRDIETDRDDAAITTAVIAMAHELGLKVVAEGVETAAQLEFLKSHGCDEAQGYFIARPMPEENVPAFVERLRTAPAGALSPDDGD